MESGSEGYGAARLYYVFDVLISARVLYAFVKAYFRARFDRQEKAQRLLLQQQQQQSRGAGAVDVGAGAGDDLMVSAAGGDAVSSSAANAAQIQRALHAAGDADTGLPPKKKVRVYMDGCFDMMHFGHANALRQARMLGDELVVGIVPDHEIVLAKGPPVMNNVERRSAVESVKWVDEIIEDVPYDVTGEFLDRLLNEYCIDFIVHGDDPCFGKDGTDAYAEVKKAGRFRTIKRTEGVSSTDIVGRMLLSTRDHHLDGSLAQNAQNTNGDSVSDQVQQGTQQHLHSSLKGETVLSLAEGNSAGQLVTRVSTFLPTTRRLLQFAAGARAPQRADVVVYVDGAFDMFHCGHIETLKAAKQLGDFLLVGIHDDATVNKHRGRNFPIMNLHERTLSVLSCRYVDEVIIGAPWQITEDMLKTMNISYVVHGTYFDESADAQDRPPLDPYALPKSLGIYREIQSKSDLSVLRILDRIVENRGQFLKRQEKKTKQEANYLENHKTYVEEL
ncbi:Ethanolamine-phosphate cytidylyltransferase [Porphyridium purpureum]|uniref:ethanolamine-phosphate cytidylyltransferase n=1 Tax=Porphyridium purpureum TaxID=35688 RepID=A0A5J4YM60_PORPP|nr:Ethanolamine-phosphate cytidylyltransferase [Porphyridium purpureum]|eukprot:POR5510..scf249_10